MHRLVFQYFKLNSRIIAIIGLLMTTISCLLMADWQAIPYDPCTELSPFHHPDIVSTYKQLQLSEPFEYTDKIKRAANCLEMYQTNALPTIYVTVKLDFSQLPVSAEGVKCKEIDTCSEHCTSSSGQCLHYTFDDNLCILERTTEVEYSTNFPSGKPADHYLCRQVFSDSSFSSMCITIYQGSHDINNLADALANETQSLHTVHSQALQLLQVDLYAMAVKKCENTSVPGHQCYWIPNSIITHQQCSDCPTICRSLQQSLNFVQFCIGAALLMVSIPIAWVPVAALISDRVHREAQVSYNPNLSS